MVSDDGAVMSQWTCRAALQRSVAKVFYHAGFEEFQPSALDSVTDIASNFFTQLARTFNVYREAPKVRSETGIPMWKPRFTSEETILHALRQNGVDLEALDSYVKEDVERLGSKLGVMHERMKAHLNELLVRLYCQGQYYGKANICLASCAGFQCRGRWCRCFQRWERAVLFRRFRRRDWRRFLRVQGAGFGQGTGIFHRAFPSSPEQNPQCLPGAERKVRTSPLDHHQRLFADRILAVPLLRLETCGRILHHGSLLRSTLCATRSALFKATSWKNCMRTTINRSSKTKTYLPNSVFRNRVSRRRARSPALESVRFGNSSRWPRRSGNSKKIRGPETHKIRRSSSRRKVAPTVLRRPVQVQSRVLPSRLASSSSKRRRARRMLRSQRKTTLTELLG